MKKIQNPFLNVGEFLADKIYGRKEGNQELHQELTVLLAGDKEAEKAYYAKKIADTLLILTLGLFLTFLVFVMEGSDSRVVEDNLLERPDYGMGNREEELTVQVEGEEETEQITVTVQERSYTEQQVDELLKRAQKELELNLKGENTSLDEVRLPLYFPVSLENGAVSVSWLTMPYGIIDDTGILGDALAEEGTLVEIQAMLSCQGKELLYETAACVYPQKLSEEESLWQEIKRQTGAADDADASKTSLKLPESINGRVITWMRKPQNSFSLCLVLTLITSLCIFLQSDQKIHKKAEERKDQLALDYSDIMWKMTMLLGAGLTIRGAFSRIAGEYKREAPKEKRYAYEEMLYTCYEMKSGVSEGTAYENFGRRCQLPKYIKLGSILSQNLKKGSKGLAALLEKEAVASMEERRNMARKLGEQAGTKLLFPMILMFGIVLVVLIVPAFLSF